MNTDSHMYGTKDIIKIEDETEAVNLDVLGLVARTATVGVVRGGKIVEKKQPTLPEHVVNIIKCVNPRCVTTTEPAVQMFHLVLPRSRADLQGIDGVRLRRSRFRWLHERTHHAEHRSRHGWREGQSRSAWRFRGA